MVFYVLNLKFKVFFVFVVETTGETESGGATIDARGSCCATFEDGYQPRLEWMWNAHHATPKLKS